MESGSNLINGISSVVIYVGRFATISTRTAFTSLAQRMELETELKATVRIPNQMSSK